MVSALCKFTYAPFWFCIFICVDLTCPVSPPRSHIVDGYDDLQDDDGKGLYIGRATLRKNVGSPFVDNDKASHSGFVMDCLMMTMRLCLSNPYHDFYGRDSIMKYVWNNAFPEETNQGNQVTTPNTKYVKMFFEVLVANFLFNDYDPVSNAGKLFPKLRTTNLSKVWVRIMNIINS